MESEFLLNKPDANKEKSETVKRAELQEVRKFITEERKRHREIIQS